MEPLRIPGIEPYNDCFFYNCFHSDLFPIVRANGGDCRTFLANGIPYFAMQKGDHGSRLLTRFCLCNEYSELLAEQGITAEKGPGAFPIPAALNRALDSSMPVILGVDGWELPYRKDLYHILHWPHSVLVYGREPEKKDYLVLDQPTRDEMQFAEYRIGKAELVQANESFCRYKATDLLFSGDEMLQFRFCDSPVLQSAEAIGVHWERNRARLHDKIQKGLRDAEGFTALLAEYLEYPARYADACGFVLDGLNDIVKQKRWEVFFLNSLPPRFKQKATFCHELLERWNDVRNLAGYLILSCRPREKTRQHICVKYRALLEKETCFAELAEGENKI